MVCKKEALKRAKGINLQKGKKFIKKSKRKKYVHLCTVLYRTKTYICSFIIMLAID